MNEPKIQDEASLWHFAINYYQRPGVAELCLSLQDNWQADVCLLLWCLWLEARGQALSHAQLLHAQQQLQPWRDTVITPLRQLRRNIKQRYGQQDGAIQDTAIEALRQQIKTAELAGEQWQLQQLQALASWPPSAVCAGDNVSLYLTQLGLSETAYQQACHLLLQQTV